jgi:hypothetical protein
LNILVKLAQKAQLALTNRSNKLKERHKNLLLDLHLNNSMMLYLLREMRTGYSNLISKYMVLSYKRMLLIRDYSHNGERRIVRHRQVDLTRKN